MIVRAVVPAVSPMSVVPAVADVSESVRPWPDVPVTKPVVFSGALVPVLGSPNAVDAVPVTPEFVEFVASPRVSVCVVPEVEPSGSEKQPPRATSAPYSRGRRQETTEAMADNLGGRTM